MMARIVEEKQANVPIRKMAMRFHRSLAGAISDLMKNYPDLPLTVSGGCFQNRILVQLLQETEMDRKRSVAWPGLVPVNDSGIAIGQTLAALAWHDTISQRDQGSGVPKLCV
jgi:hydrogenase maturation protein HypF